MPGDSDRGYAKFGEPLQHEIRGTLLGADSRTVRVPVLPSEERRLLEPQAGQDLLHPRVGQGPDALPETDLLYGGDLRDDHDAPFRKVSLAILEQYVPRLLRPTEVRRQRAHDHGRDARAVEDVVLDHHVGMGMARDGPQLVVLPHPEHVAAVNPRRRPARRSSCVRLRAHRSTKIPHRLLGTYSRCGGFFGAGLGRLGRGSASRGRSSGRGGRGPPGRPRTRRASRGSCVRRRFKINFTQLIGYEGEMG